MGDCQETGTWRDTFLVAKREIGEEMGVRLHLSEPHFLGKAQFSILPKPDLPRLKSIYIYLFKAAEKVTEFNVATEEGIVNVEWFNVETALRLVPIVLWDM